MIERERAEAVERLSALLERDALTVDRFNALVEQVLASATAEEVALVLAESDSLAVSPVLPPESLVLVSRGEVISERPMRLPPVVEIRCESGVMKVDLSLAELDETDTDIELEMITGVLTVLLPRDVEVTLDEHVGTGGVFRNKLRPPLASGLPRVHLHVRNEGGVVKIAHRRRWLGRRR